MSRHEVWALAIFVAVVLVVAGIAYIHHLHDTGRL
jgi:hypothetical protein